VFRPRGQTRMASRSSCTCVPERRWPYGAQTRPQTFLDDILFPRRRMWTVQIAHLGRWRRGARSMRVRKKQWQVFAAAICQGAIRALRICILMSPGITGRRRRRRARRKGACANVFAISVVEHLLYGFRDGGDPTDSAGEGCANKAFSQVARSRGRNSAPNRKAMLRLTSSR